MPKRIQSDVNGRQSAFNLMVLITEEEMKKKNIYNDDDNNNNNIINSKVSCTV